MANVATVGPLRHLGTEPNQFILHSREGQSVTIGLAERQLRLIVPAP